MAVSRQTSSVANIPGAPQRYSFAKINEPIAVPGLLDLQRDSYDWLIGTPEWREREQERRGADAQITSGLEDILNELSPIEDYSGNMSLSLSEPRFEPVKNTVDEAKEKDINYSAPLYVTAEFINSDTQEIKSQTVFIGDFPMMTEKGTFIVNGTERVIVSQLVRSPGVYFDRSIDKSTERPLHAVKVIPSRGAWLEFDVDKRDTVGVRIDRKRRQPVTVLLKALGWTEEKTGDRFGFSELRMPPLEALPIPTRLCWKSTASNVRASSLPEIWHSRCWTILSSTRSVMTWHALVVTRSTASWAWVAIMMV